MEKINNRLLNWASILEDNTREQAITASGMKFIRPHIALMPDAHLGKGATVGSVIPTVGAVMPAAVGVDIGCGMIAVRTQFTYEDVLARGWRNLPALREAIENSIPLGPGKNNDVITPSAERRLSELYDLAHYGEGRDWTDPTPNDFDPEGYTKKWRGQLGTLGGGNHFIEVSLDELDRVWLFLHSGSRGIGNRIAQTHIKIAQSRCATWMVDLPDPDLAYLPEGTREFDEYITEMRWAQRFAFLNREEMMDRVSSCLSEWIEEDVVEAERINCHHNYTEQERHFGRTVWLTRKGAINAEKDRPGLIPGSMGTASYIVTGLGNRVALNSAPHGAGRVHSRAAAKRSFTYEQLRASMEGIEWRDSAKFLDEIPAAYKSIDQIIYDAKDLVTVRNTLRQIVNVKGE